ncbi:hypothetical protein CPAR01_04069 [Colletotrichum paranaense]|uniref:Uncharacterized protein n=1 Tax=Colletotrichum paranaense TaxID=1914294 RepID=A0ABQ9SV87_9PEZI|nr:uncharacterized protein CPAR01_04069 [Colletotrichum paranaense]KAK1543436.1 hypothetical protein CPAR01_04069 [Colletotrichum paranaense]
MTGRRYILWYYVGGAWIVDDSFLGWMDLKVDHVTNGNLSEISDHDNNMSNNNRKWPPSHVTQLSKLEGYE